MRNVLTSFVDRRDELKRFLALLQDDEKPVMVVWGQDGLGKSSLLVKLIHECSLQQVRKAEVFTTKYRFNSYLDIMRKIRDDLGAEHFPDFTSVVNHLYPDPTRPVPPPPININIGGTQNVLESATFRDVNVGGDIAGVLVKDLMINLPSPTTSISPRDRIIALTDAFLKNLSAVVGNQKVVIFCDDIQEWPEETSEWLWEELIGSLRDGRLRNVRLVLCGREKPEISTAAGRILREAPLKPLELPDIELYLESRRYIEAERASAAQMLLVGTGGIPLQVATYVDTMFEKFPSKKERDD